MGIEDGLTKEEVIQQAIVRMREACIMRLLMNDIKLKQRLTLK